MKSLEIACAFRDNNVVDKLEAWSPAWYASFGEGKHIFAGCATWSVPFTIEPNDPEGESAGHWGLMNAPEGNISWGGTTLGISKTCKDKALAWTFVKFATLSTEGAEALNSIGLLTSAKAPYKEKPELESFKSKWFGDQDLGIMFIGEIVPTIKIRPMNIDDNVIHEALNLVTTSLNNDRSMTAEQAMRQLKEELAMQLPDYTIE
jgi:multiple sugar transport system substrate-binding protein